MNARFRQLILLVPLILVALPIDGCSNAQIGEGVQLTSATPNMLTMPPLNAIDLQGEPLDVVATTSLIGDVAKQVGGDAIKLTTLIQPGQDPHSFEPAARDLTAVAAADIIFVNGWNLEEGLIGELETIGEDVLIVPISAGITPIMSVDDHADEDEHSFAGIDPHVWLDIEHVERWTKNVQNVLSGSDPDNAGIYQVNADAYLAELNELEAYTAAELLKIPESNRYLVTNHDAFSYFAYRYNFTLLGTVIPSVSAVAEPSASDLTQLIAQMKEYGVCAIFTETTANDSLAHTVANELTGCEEVKVLQLYSGAIGSPGSGLDSYNGMFRANVDTIVDGLK